MKNKFVSVLLMIMVITVSACGRSAEGIEEPATAGTTETEEVSDSVTEEQSMAAATASTEDVTKESASTVEVKYDTTYLKEEAGAYTYSLKDESVIDKYNELYSEAFEELIKSNEEASGFMDQSYIPSNQAVSSNLLYRDTKEEKVVKTGSNFEMDYGFDILNVGYTYVDLDSDGVFELIFGVLHGSDPEDDYVNNFERAYTLVDGKPIKICEGGCRSYYYLGSDGCIYYYGSCGADHSGIWRVHFDASGLKGAESVDWGEIGFVDDEFYGYWERPVHVMGPITDFYEMAKLPENSISDEEDSALYDEWEQRRVKIDWIPMGEYLK